MPRSAPLRWPGCPTPATQRTSRTGSPQHQPGAPARAGSAAAGPCLQHVSAATAQRQRMPPPEQQQVAAAAVRVAAGSSCPGGRSACQDSRLCLTHSCSARSAALSAPLRRQSAATLFHASPCAGSCGARPQPPQAVRPTCPAASCDACYAGCKRPARESGLCCAQRRCRALCGQQRRCRCRGTLNPRAWCPACCVTRLKACSARSSAFSLSAA